MQSITKARMPSQDELIIKRKQLRALEAELAEKEYAYQTDRHVFYVFEERYRERLGKKYVELDELNARVLDIQSRLDLDSEDLQVEAELARERADESRMEYEYVDPDFKMNEDDIPVKVEPPDELKRCFRELAKRVHPDLARDPSEREIRHAWMARLNQAYREMDQGKMESLLEEWEGEQNPPDAESARLELVKVLKRTHHIREELDAVDLAWESMKQSQMYCLSKMIERAWQRGEDLLSEMELEIDEKMKSLNQEMEALKKEESLF